MAKDRIAAIPKEVIVLQKQGGGMFAQGDIDPARYVENISIVRACIESGTEIPERFYRRSTGRDLVLDEYGWLHFHVDLQPPDDVLLFVQEEADAVIFIALTRHDVFQEYPRARSLFGLRSKIATVATAVRARAKRMT